MKVICENLCGRQPAKSNQSNWPIGGQFLCKLFTINNLQKKTGFRTVRVRQGGSNQFDRKWWKGKNIRNPIFLPNSSFCQMAFGAPHFWAFALPADAVILGA
jgi:hypothetical protein